MSDRVRNPKDRFSHDAGHTVKLVLRVMLRCLGYSVFENYVANAYMSCKEFSKQSTVALALWLSI